MMDVRAWATNVEWARNRSGRETGVISGIWEKGARGRWNEASTRLASP